jgi:hypothetical protein
MNRIPYNPCIPSNLLISWILLCNENNDAPEYRLQAGFWPYLATIKILSRTLGKTPK